MAVLSRDITLLVSEHIDTGSLARLMLSCRANYRLIRGYERSIVKAKIARLIRDPALAPPLGAVLSSSAPNRPDLAREVLGPLTFAVARELEAREGRIGRLLGSPASPLASAIGRLALFRDLPPRRMDRLLDGLRDACRAADRIADCAAAVRLAASGAGEDAPGTAAAAALDERIHLARQRYIRGLGPVRLAFLTLLTSLAGALYARRPADATLGTHTHTHDDDDEDADPFRWERVVAFKEAFLRHGTVILCALLRFGARRRRRRMRMRARRGRHRGKGEGEGDEDEGDRRAAGAGGVGISVRPDAPGEMDEAEEEDEGDVGGAPSPAPPPPSMPPDPREALILRWIRQR
ncbi:hypothetical protein VTH06DRAFT_7172 [Thermothelomyces fergusii]